MTTEELHRCEKEYRAAARLAEDMRELRNRTVRDAIRAGWTHARIAEATGLTRGRIGQIADPTNQPS